MPHQELFANLVNLAAADGKFTEEEVELLARRAEHWGISTDEFETAMAGISTGMVEIRIPESQTNRITLLKEMIRMMAVDGELSEIEKRLCATASARMDFSTGEFDLLLDQVLRDLE
jgi:uncharacterized tellurite resistance protein B-like protein